MASIIDKSLDEIIKDEKKAKKKEILLKKKKQQQQQQQQGNKNKKQQGTANRRQRNAAKGSAPARRNQGQPTQNQRKPGNKGVVANKQGGNRQTAGNRQRGGNQQTGGRPKVVANRLKNKQALNNAGKQMLNRVKKAQGRQQTQSKQNQQVRRKDARQNILDRRRGIQSSNEVQGRLGGNANPVKNRNRQISNQPQRQNNKPKQRNRRQQNAGQVNELRVSFANISRQQQQNRVQQPKKKFTMNRASFAIGKTGTTLNDRFSGRNISF